VVFVFFGGAASGKSEVAENFTVSFEKKLVYFATLDKNSGGDTVERIEKHKKMREGKGFFTVELSNEDLQKFMKSDFSFLDKFDFSDSSILLEDLGNLVARVVFYDFENIEKNNFCDLSFQFIKEINSRCKNLVIVSNDIFCENLNLADLGMSIYLKTLSKLNNKISETCDEVFRVIAGIPIKVSLS